jgi:Zn-dependent metalloprotease
MKILPRLSITVAVLMFAAALAQTSESHAYPPDPIEEARAVLTAKARALGLDPDELQALSVRDGLGARYVRFQETFDGIPVEGGQVVVGLPNNRNQQPLVARGGEAPAAR